MPLASQDTARQCLAATRTAIEREVEVRAERVINWIRIAFVGAAGLLDAIGAFSSGHRSVGIGIAVVSAVLIGLLVVVDRFLSQATYRSWIKYVTTTHDFALISAVFVYYTSDWLIANPAQLPIPFFGVTLLVNLVSALRAGRAIVVYSTTLATISTLAQGLQIDLDDVVLMFQTFGVLISGGLALALAMTRVHMLMRLQQRNSLMRFLPKPMVDAVDRGELDLALGGKTVEATILMTDIRGFTTLAEAMDPQELVGRLNRFLTRMTNVIHQHGGIVDKYIGDAILAVFGAPEQDPDHALHAVRAAMAMREELAAINEEDTALGMQPLQIGIGIHTGPVVAGNVGSAERMDYTVMGDTVNTTSRIESLTKTYREALLVSENTRLQLGGSIATREVADAEIRGRKQSLKLFTPAA